MPSNGKRTMAAFTDFLIRRKKDRKKEIKRKKRRKKD
jgi:hypothetical protein